MTVPSQLEGVTSLHISATKVVHIPCQDIIHETFCADFIGVIRIEMIQLFVEQHFILSFFD